MPSLDFLFDQAGQGTKPFNRICPG